MGGTRNSELYFEFMRKSPGSASAALISACARIEELEKELKPTQANLRIRMALEVIEYLAEHEALKKNDDFLMQIFMIAHTVQGRCPNPHLDIIQGLEEAHAHLVSIGEADAIL